MSDDGPTQQPPNTTSFIQQKNHHNATTSNHNNDNNNSIHFVVDVVDDDNNDGNKDQVTKSSCKMSTNMLDNDVVFTTSSITIIDDDDEQKNSLTDNISATKKEKETFVRNAGDAVVAASKNNSIIETTSSSGCVFSSDQIHTEDDPTNSCLKSQALDHDISNVIIVNNTMNSDITNNNNRNDDENSGPYYKDQVNSIRNARTSQNYPESGGVAEFITTTNYANNNTRIATTLAAAINVVSSTTSTEMAVNGSDITLSEYNITKSTTEEVEESGNETFGDDQQQKTISSLSSSNEMMQKSSYSGKVPSFQSNCIVSDRDTVNRTNITKNNNQDHHTAIGPYYKDQVNNIRCARMSENYQKSGGVVEFIAATINNTNNTNKEKSTPLPSTTTTEMAVTGSDITSLGYDTKSVEEKDEEGNETFSDDRIPLSNEMQSSSPIDDLPEQQKNHTDHNENHDHPVVVEAYTVSSFLIVEAKAVVPRNNHYIILFFIVMIIIIAGLLFGLLCQNGSCRLRSNDNDNNNNVDVVPSSAPTSQRQPITDPIMLVDLVDQYRIETSINQEV